MKNVLFLIIAIAMVSMGCAPGSGYTVRGKVKGVSEGKVHFVVEKDGSRDTLASGEVKNGSFEIRGNCSGVIPVMVELEKGGLGYTVLYLENATFDVELDPQNMIMSPVKGGGEAQKLANEYMNIDIACMQAINGIRDEFVALAGDFKNPRFRELKSFVDSVQDLSNQKREVFLKEHSTSYLALFNLMMIARRLELKELNEAFSKFPSEVQNSYGGQVLREYIEKLKKLGIGELAPDFTVKSPDGKSFSLYSVKAKVKLIDFWASWCGPCRALTPQLIEIYKEFHPKGLEIVGISFDNDKNAWVKAIEEEKMPWIQGSDLQGYEQDKPLIVMYGIFGIPHLVLMDENNRIVARNVRGEELRQALAKLLE